MNIAFLFNVRHVKPSLEDARAMREAEFDEPSTIRGIEAALKELGHTVFLIEADQNAYGRLKKLKNRIDLAFNVAEGLQGESREAQVPALLEMLGIPYVGSGPLAQALCLNKGVAKKILRYHGVPTPDFAILHRPEDADRCDLPFPVIVKPNGEGSSKGISQHSVVRDRAELKKQAKAILESLGGAALAETFLTGREFTVAMIGNDPVEVLPPVEIDFSDLPEGYLPLDSYEVKWLVDQPGSDHETVLCPAPIDAALWNEIRSHCLTAKAALGILDWCRIDLRLDAADRPYILEINQIPGIIPDPAENSRFPLAARAAGYNYAAMLEKIIQSACRRYGLAEGAMARPAVRRSAKVTLRPPVKSAKKPRAPKKDVI